MSSRVEPVPLVIVGAGPAGLSAALEVSRAGKTAVLVDAAARPGGQALRMGSHDVRWVQQRGPAGLPVSVSELLGVVRAPGIEYLPETTCWAIDGHDLYVAREGKGTRVLQAANLIVACGSYDRPWPCEGWEALGVYAAGGGHAMAIGEGVPIGKRVIVAGRGPLTIGFAAALRKEGTSVAAVALENRRFGPQGVIRAGLAAARARQLTVLLTGLFALVDLRLNGVPIIYRSRVSKIIRDDAGAVAGVCVELAGPALSDQRVVKGDAVLLGYGQYPSTELLRAASCGMLGLDSGATQVPIRDAYLRTTMEWILAAGDCAGEGGVNVAVLEGAVAGLVSLSTARPLSRRLAKRLIYAQRRLTRLRAFRRALDALFTDAGTTSALPPLRAKESIVCRCEDVTTTEVLDAVRRFGRSVTSVRAYTRAGMGPCQGRNCLASVISLLRQAGDADNLQEEALDLRVQPPVRPVRLGDLASPSSEDEDTTVGD